MKTSHILLETAKKLKINPHSSSNLEARLLLAFVLNCSINNLFLQDDLQINQAQKNKLKKLITRRSNGEPMSYLLGKREFYGHDFIVDNNVLDPRCDSEAMIELIKDDFRNFSTQPFKIIELGVGSGCLVISILHEFSLWTATGVDISKKALKIAKKNTQKFNLSSRLKLINSDLFTKIKSTQKFDIIISNPPYIPTDDINNLQKEVAFFEPRIALDGGSDGLEFYRKIAINSLNYLQKKGSIFVEIGYNQESEVIDIFRSFNFYLQSKKTDLSRIVRILHFKLK
jgi:release factor glutamine methyltransferase